MKKIIGGYSIFIGILVIGFWIMSLSTGNVPELETEPIEIYFHLSSEFLMAILAIISGIGLLKKQKWADLLFVLSSGMVIYSVINSSGYFGNDNEWAMVIMFMVLLVLSALTSFLILKDSLKNSR